MECAQRAAAALTGQRSSERHATKMEVGVGEVLLNGADALEVDQLEERGAGDTGEAVAHEDGGAGEAVIETLCCLPDLLAPRKFAGHFAFAGCQVWLQQI